ncbi:MAG: TetR/AcrR family transcriptional regulator [Gordonia sp. (in: high G+C Gram-positive bacteria)]
MFTERVQMSRSERRSSSRAKVLASAERLFRLRGFAETTVRDIAGDAGVSAGTVMGVGDKDGLLVAVFDEWISAVHRQRGAGQAAGVDAADVVDAVLALLVPFIEHFGRDPELSREYAAIVVRGRHGAVIFDELGPVLIGEIAAVLERDGHRGNDAFELASAVYFAYLGMLLAGTSRVPIGVDVDRVRRVVERIVSPMRS